MKLSLVIGAGAVDAAYKNLYKVGGLAAFVAAALIVGLAIAFTLYPQPETAIDWFELFQDNTLVGLLDFWALEVLGYVMFALVFLALCFALKEADPGLMAIALAFSLLGIGIFLATNRPFAMLSLSDQYAAASTDAERAIFLAAGQATLANTGQRVVGGFNVGLFLLSVAGLLVSGVMLKSAAFSKTIAYVGLAAWALSLLDYLRQILTQSEIIALAVILPHTLLLMAWFVLVGRRLYQLGRALNG
ncbi:MAG: DUF4386 family protein [Chloroflexota bacterium]|nr:MAG: DUF4386 family protein [Chloroflexota bacterium]